MLEFDSIIECCFGVKTADSQKNQELAHSHSFIGLIVEGVSEDGGISWLRKA